ncbi:acetamidase/formamidase family protein [Halopseudomonas bauzanensis]|uniref:Acetamidase n=1 Tax=Halopseudomonas bauzanensis TaxID=653930 RepID=A0A4V5NKV1_9GAMM|nr:acetamidase/formamidase family protein [Halopseudomonas bauzanensis]TKA93207.1 acetamidase [Halopseudomonas bauzanensis]
MSIRNRFTRLLPFALLPLAVAVNADSPEPFAILEQLSDTATQLEQGEYAGNFYVPSSLDNVIWGYLPNRTDKPVLTVPSGSVVTFDTVSHEGLLEDQGRDPAAYFGSHGVKHEHVLAEAIALTASDRAHDFSKDGPHVVTGPVAIEGAEPGDVLKVEILAVEPRVPYGVISNRHGKGALPGEYPKTPAQADASAEHPERYGNLSIFTPIEWSENGYVGVLDGGDGRKIKFPLQPFMGIMGVAADTDEPVHSVPPAHYGGNVDVNDFGAGATAYYPVAVPGALFYTGDSHFVQGDGEVALTALEGSARATFRLTLLKGGASDIPGKQLSQPMGETDDFWITLGLDEDLDEAMKKSTREAIRFLVEQYGVDETVAYAYLSAATDFQVSQVVDKTKGINSMIRKADFSEFQP